MKSFIASYELWGERGEGMMKVSLIYLKAKDIRDAKERIIRELMREEQIESYIKEFKGDFNKIWENSYSKECDHPEYVEVVEVDTTVNWQKHDVFEQ